MQIGKMDRRVVIESVATVPSSSGAPVETWSTLATIWAHKMQRSGREFFADDQPLSEEKVVWRIRWRTDVTTKMRLTYGGDIFKINEVKEVGRQAGLDLLTTAVRV